MSHQQTNHPIGSTAASVKAYRNLTYLESKGVIPAQPQSARRALELTNDNIRRANLQDKLQWELAGLQAIQEAANAMPLNTGAAR